jgi:hypothetical protein
MPSSPSPTPPVAQLAAGLVAEINGAYGLYLDATSGFKENVARIVSTGAKDDTQLLMGKGAPNDPANVLQHQTTVGIYKARNRHDGPNSSRLARYLIVIVYELWEAEYRGAIAEAVGIARDDLKSPVFGDLRLLRNAILHKKGVLPASDATRLTVIAPPTAGQIELTDSEVETLVRLVKAGLDIVVKQHAGVDPQFRTIWQVR